MTLEFDYHEWNGEVRERPYMPGTFCRFMGAGHDVDAAADLASAAFPWASVVVYGRNAEGLPMSRRERTPYYARTHAAAAADGVSLCIESARGTCEQCGVSLDDCGACGGRGYHRSTCPEMVSA